MTKKLTLVLLFLLFSTSGFAAREKAAVLKVLDGDMIGVFFKGEKKIIRLIGVDAPESKASRKTRDIAKKKRISHTRLLEAGLKARVFTQSYVKPGDVIEIEFDKRKEDWNGHLLSYVYIADGRMLNELLLKAGFVKPISHDPNTKYQNRLEKAYVWADKNGAGLHQKKTN